MPKGRMQTNEKTKPTFVHRGHKIGGRKSTRGAAQLNDAELQELVDGKGRPKDQAKARKVLDQRRKSSRILKEVKETAKGLLEAGSMEQQDFDEIVSVVDGTDNETT